VQQVHPTAAGELWTMDEHRLGLKPILRRVWRRKGQGGVVRVQPRYEWLYLYACVRPHTGQAYWLLLPTVSTQAMTLALQEFARDVGAGPERQIILVLDQAGWHTSADLVVPDGLHLELLPAYSPELQPAERLWTLTDEVVVNRHFATLDDLQTTQAEHCLRLSAQRDRVRAQTQFHWWPTTA
jgi:transposase